MLKLALCVGCVLTATFAQAQQRKLVWSDEFNYTGEGVRTRKVDGAPACRRGRPIAGRSVRAGRERLNWRESIAKRQLWRRAVGRTITASTCVRHGTRENGDRARSDVAYPNPPPAGPAQPAEGPERSRLPHSRWSNCSW